MNIESHNKPQDGHLADAVKRNVHFEAPQILMDALETRRQWLSDHEGIDASTTRQLCAIIFRYLASSPLEDDAMYKDYGKARESALPIDPDDMIPRDPDEV